jgi:hypothetical protein
VELSASLDVVGIVLSLLLILSGYIVSSYRQRNLLKQIDRKLDRVLEKLHNTSEAKDG